MQYPSTSESTSFVSTWNHFLRIGNFCRNTCELTNRKFNAKKYTLNQKERYIIRMTFTDGFIWMNTRNYGRIRKHSIHLLISFYPWWQARPSICIRNHSNYSKTTLQKVMKLLLFFCSKTIGIIGWKKRKKSKLSR